MAEDNVVNQKLIYRLLEKRGHRVALAQNGREALKALEKQHFDVLLMDEQMPEMNGLETTIRIREREKSSGTHWPIIALTASAMQGDKERAVWLAVWTVTSRNQSSQKSYFRLLSA